MFKHFSHFISVGLSTLKQLSASYYSQAKLFPRAACLNAPVRTALIGMIDRRRNPAANQGARLRLPLAVVMRINCACLNVVRSIGSGQCEKIMRAKNRSNDMRNRHHFPNNFYWQSSLFARECDYSYQRTFCNYFLTIVQVIQAPI